MSVETPVEVSVSRRYRFSASHRLHLPQFTAEHNRELFGKCNNPFGHGHNYTVQVTVAGPVDKDTGMVVDLLALDTFVRREVLDVFDLANLNTAPSLEGNVPSTENLAMVLWRLMEPFAAQHRGLRLERIRLEETRNNAFDYFGEETGERAA